MIYHLQINEQTAITRKQSFICRNAPRYIHNVHIVKSSVFAPMLAGPRAALLAQEFSIEISDLSLANKEG